MFPWVRDPDSYVFGRLAFMSFRLSSAQTSGEKISKKIHFSKNAFKLKKEALWAVSEFAQNVRA